MAHKHHWHILGAGSMGLLWAYYLRQGGHRVSIICRSDAEYELLQKSLPLQCTQDGTSYCIDVELSRAFDAQTIENLLICTKAQHSLQALRSVLPRISMHGYVLLMQNGTGYEPELLSLLTTQQCFKACTSEAAKKVGPLHVEHRGVGETYLGSLQKTDPLTLLGRLNCQLKQHTSEAISIQIWEKLIVNCVINPLSCLHNCQNGELLSIDGFDAKLVLIVDECLDLAEKLAIPLRRKHCIERIYSVIKNTAANSSSMREDILQGRETEIAYINGYIVAQAEVFALHTPYNQQLVRSVEKLQTATKKKTKG